MFPAADGPFDDLDATGGRRLPDLTRKPPIQGWQIVALIGSLAMIVGVLVPFSQGRSLWQIGRAADGVPISASIIIGVAQISIVFIVLRWHWALWLIAFAAFMVVLLSSVGPGPTMPGLAPALPAASSSLFGVAGTVLLKQEADAPDLDQPAAGCAELNGVGGRRNLICHVYKPVGWYLILFGAFLLIVGACTAAYVDYLRTSQSLAAMTASRMLAFCPNRPNPTTCRATARS
jgi:hypothetical protein